jgi:DNA-binding helix-hairpin-helix protein with protein kinase domain
MPGHFVVTQGRRHEVALEQTGLGGGEGNIYRVRNFQGCVAKIYHVAGTLPPDRAKLEAMIDKPPRLTRLVISGTGQVAGAQPRDLSAMGGTVVLPLIAWPTHLVEDAHGKCVGFLMPEIPIDRTVPLTKYMARSTMRSLSEDDRGLPRRIQICRNLAAMVAEIHQQKHFIVDLKAQNILVYKEQGIVCLVDADSFSIAPKRPGEDRYAASAFTPEYLAAELLRNELPPSAVINDTQDRFALAALMYQVLNYGFHPFQGTPKFQVNEWNIALSIREGLYANGLTPSEFVAPSPGSSHDCWDVETRKLFDRAFTASPSKRPTAMDWRNHFDALQEPRVRALVPCDYLPSAGHHRHFAGLPCPECRREGKRLQQAACPPVRPPTLAGTETYVDPGRSAPATRTVQSPRSGSKGWLSRLLRSG